MLRQDELLRDCISLSTLETLLSGSLIMTYCAGSIVHGGIACVGTGDSQYMRDPRAPLNGGGGTGRVCVQKASGAATEAAKDSCTRAITEGDGAYERELMAPLLSPFMRGMLGKLAESGLGGAAALGMLSKMFGCFGGSNKPTPAKTVAKV